MNKQTTNTFIIIFEMAILFVLIVLFYTMNLYTQNLNKATENHFSMIDVANKLKESSDNLTHFARTYTATNNKKFKEQYLKTLAIRDGQVSRPKDYNSIYWYLSKEHQNLKHPKTEKISLHSLIEELPFSDLEHTLLTQAEFNASDLVAIENAAFTAMELEIPNQELAIKLLHSKKYYDVKYKVMNPIDNFIIMSNKRNEQNTSNLKSIISLNIILLIISIIVFIVGNIFIYLYFRKKEQKNIWFKDGIALVSKNLANVDIENGEILEQITNYVYSGVSALYLYDEETNRLRRDSTYAYMKTDSLKNEIELGEGIVGQVAKQKKEILLCNILNENLSINSLLKNTLTMHSYTLPLLYQNKLYGVLEFGFSTKINPNSLKLLTEIAPALATFIYSTQQNEKIKYYLMVEKDNNIAMQEQQQQLEEANSQMEEQQQQLEETNSQMVEQQQQLKEKNNELEVSNKYKSEFLANMSHELRTPLNSIIVLSSILENNKSENLDAEERKKASIIHKSGNELLLLIDDVLDLSKVEAGKMILDKEIFSSKDLIENLHNSFYSQIETKNLLFTIQDNFNSQIENDKTKILQILKNFISNSIKFTKVGSISLEIDTLDDTRFIISVVDTGIGIASKNLESVFNAFEQADGSTTREYGGTGLGLSISKKMAGFIGGEIRLESELLKGSKFSLILPSSINNKSEVMVDTSKVEQKVLKYTSKKNESNELLGSKILVVDDDIRNIFVLSELLTSHGSEILTASNGKEAIDILRANDNNVDVILMDIMMPVMDGYEATRIIKEDTKSRHIPIFALTAKAMQEDKEKALDAGCNDYITKPLDTNLLLSIVTAYLDQRQ